MNTTQTVARILQLAAIVTLVIGTVTLLIPGEVVKVFDGYSAPNFHFVRFIGTALIGFSVTNWLYSLAKDMRMVLPAIYGNLTSLVLAVGVDVAGLITKVLAPMAGFILLLHLLFVGLFGYCVLVIRQADDEV